ncbi:hypothetical protein SEVIR_8G172000v4 [Setaria viridis]|uniref:Hydrophobic seed protein domain-containing protein n=1 Tax=Setaria viridis TaxID=4556 RepID=A0A4U6TG83_SETVI|nr:hypothetical protein SEVIR_8G172000v2 [Setaria viridis]
MILGYPSFRVTFFLVIQLILISICSLVPSPLASRGCGWGPFLTPCPRDPPVTSCPRPPCRHG